MKNLYSWPRVGRQAKAAACALLLLCLALPYPHASAHAAPEPPGPANEPLWGPPVTVGPAGCNYMDLQAAIDDAGAYPAMIELQADIDTSDSLTVGAAQTIKIISGGGVHTITADGSRDFSVITNHGELWLENIIVSGADKTGNGGGVYNTGILIMDGGRIAGNKTGGGWISCGGGVYNAGTFFMRGEAAISENTAGAGRSNGMGGGVYNDGGSFIMEGNARISGNTAVVGTSFNCGGGGVFNSKGSFTMNGGSISGNTALEEPFYPYSPSSDGGGVFNDEGSFTMNGGTIGGTLPSDANTAGYYGGGVFSYNASFAMNGGAIMNNSALAGGGVCLTQSTYFEGDILFTMNNGLISGNTTEHDTGEGGGVLVCGGFVMTDSEISGNTAGGSLGSGGCVWIHGDFTMTRSKISGNTAGDLGGGVFIIGGFTMTDSEIDGNSVVPGGDGPYPADTGGGVYFWGDYHSEVSFTMENSRINKNTAVFAGGICLGDGNLTMDGGEINGNTAAVGGGVAMLASGPSRFTMNSGAISGNKADSAISAFADSMTPFILARDYGLGIHSGDGGGLWVLYAEGMMANPDIPPDIPYAFHGFFEMNGGIVSDNVADGNGGGVYTTDYQNLTIGEGAVFSGNRAATSSPVRNPDDNAVYAANIHAANWTAPFNQGYNNYDVNHDYTQPAFTVTVRGSYAAESGAGIYLAGEPITVDAGSRAGYAFAGWTADEGRMGFANAGSAATTFTMPSEDITLTANWSVYDDGGYDGDAPPIEAPPTEPPAEQPPVEQPPAEQLPAEPPAGQPPSSANPLPPAQPPTDAPPPILTPAPGGTDPVIPPNPTDSLHTVASNDDGIYVELDQDGAPLGEWHWDDDSEQWIFDEYPPLGKLPQTGDAGVPIPMALLLCWSLLCLSMALLSAILTRN